MQRGFSLVELSIVLVILGLLVGGILAGQSLIRASELRSIASDAGRYQTAIMSFRDKYFGLPGDIKNATNFWGIAGGTTGNDMTCYNVSSTSKATCNGNGNGRLFLDDNVTDSSAPEWFRGIQQLANAGLIEGNFTGVHNSGGSRKAVPGENVPAGKISNTGFTLMSFDQTTNAVGQPWWPGIYNGFAFGVATVSVETGNVALKPEEAWNIDTKMDDGRPAYGMVRSIRAFTSCHTVNDVSGEYALTTNGIVCAVFFALQNPGN